MNKNLEEKIYSMSNSFLPLDVFFNDIRDNKAENYDKERAYKDLEIIANFIIDLQSQLDQANERLKEIDNFKYNYGYTNYEDSYMLEDLQSRAFQAEDDTAVVESLFDFFDICDENEILPKVEEISEKLKCAIVPKFKKDEYVYALFTQTEIYKGQIDAFDYYTNSYLIYPNEDIGNEWIKADKVFKTKLEAEKKLQELRGDKK